ncbi:hypothetical protein [Undibacterium baiyunense]|uniref:Uncharacterized protein n=1 Tax=Undibacterium baiyunense TaxID=2828731 RepID=A0A941I1Q0_9BURK|nr:hypothetical protein [Undibacterium baiyunense]MBR7745145.1 hypothetical protein [Undibacterium baiyunense]
MDSETHDASDNERKQTARGNGSIAHTIIGGFLDDLSKKEGYVEIAPKLQAVLLSDNKPTEMALRLAMFGEDIL